MAFNFPPRLPSASLKRGRAAADIDGEHSNLQKKKRRLRLFLITSRLSPQFSHPATNIVNRGSSKIAVWAKQKSLGRNLLRKAAILNRIRRGALSANEAQQGKGRLLVEQEREQEQLRLARLAFQYGSVDTYTRPVVAQAASVPPAGAVRTGKCFVVSGSPSVSRSPSPTSPSPPSSEMSSSEYRSPNEAYSHIMPHAQVPKKDYLPLGPSPLGLSNYDAFDLEDEIPDRYSHLDDDDEYTSTFPYHDEDDDDNDYDECPFSPSAITHSTTSTQTNLLPNTPPLTSHLDPCTREHNHDTDPEDTILTLWPENQSTPSSPLLIKAAKSHAKQLSSPSPFFSLANPTSNKETHAPSSPSPCTSPNFPPSSSSSTTTTTTTLASPTLAPKNQNMFASPNLLLSQPATTKDSRADSSFTRRDSAMEQEKFRQRNLIFTRFGESGGE